MKKNRTREALQKVLDKWMSRNRLKLPRYPIPYFTIVSVEPKKAAEKFKGWDWYLMSAKGHSAYLGNEPDKCELKLIEITNSGFMDSSLRG